MGSVNASDEYSMDVTQACRKLGSSGVRLTGCRPKTAGIPAKAGWIARTDASITVIERAAIFMLERLPKRACPLNGRKGPIFAAQKTHGDGGPVGTFGC